MTWKWTPCKTYSYDQIDHSVEYDDEWVKIGNFNLRSSVFEEALKTYYETTKPVVDAIYKAKRYIDADLYSRLRGVYDYTMIDHSPEYEPAMYLWTKNPGDRYVFAEERGSDGKGYWVAVQ